MYKRELNLAKLLKIKSFFLFGPRSTGKSTLIRQQIPKALVFDLLDPETFSQLLTRPKSLQERIRNARPEIVVIDEVQKLPNLLDEVHRLIEVEKVRFLLTGSSARKLRRGGANLLAGRAWRADLFSLCWREIPDFDLLKYLNVGGLPQVYTSDYPEEELKAYVNTYLLEEIQAEAVTRNLRAFSEFLDLVALSNGAEINYEGLASDSQVSADTIKNYFQILEDTLIGFKLRGYTKSKIRKATSRAKHYLFDIGLVNRLARRSEVLPKSKVFGDAFEHFIILEVKAHLSYSRKDLELCYWRSVAKHEVDLVIGDEIAVEIKSTEFAQDRDLKGLRALKEENLLRAYYLVSLDSQPRETEDGIFILPWQVFLQKLWDGELGI